MGKKKKRKEKKRICPYCLLKVVATTARMLGDVSMVSQ